MVAAETGSGKTAAFCLPILQCVSERLRSSESNQSIPTNEKSNSSTIPTIHDVKINENDKDSLLIIEGGGLLCSSAAEKLWVGGRATHGVKQGKYYYEGMYTHLFICFLMIS